MTTRRIGFCIVLVAATMSWRSSRFAAQEQVRPLWDPPAITVNPDFERVVKNPRLVSQMVDEGRILFGTKFNVEDGAGRPAATGDSKPTPRLPLLDARLTRAAGPDANSCGGCHNQPVVGGSGDFAANVFVGAHFTDPPTLATGTDVTNERNTTSTLGSGAIEMLAREMTIELRQRREGARRRAAETHTAVTVRLSAKGVGFGQVTSRPDGTYDQSQLEGVDDDLVVKPFGSKGVAISLREFTIAALNQHHGIQATERFGWERTGRRDFDEDGVADEFSIGQLSAVSLFQASLPPLSRRQPASAAEARVLRHGEALFAKVGCATCHVPYLELRSTVFTEPNPFNRPGTLTPADVSGPIRLPLPERAGSSLSATPAGILRVWAYSDLRRHVICDAQKPLFCNERKRQDNVPTDQFMTPKLWDLATSASYGHRGDCDTVSDAIVNHGGEATASRHAFEQLTDNDKRALVRFLLSLGAKPSSPRQP